MIARNLPFDGYNVWYPKVDFTGNNSGIIGSEFPFFQWIIACINSVFGYSHWTGRIVNLLISSYGAWCFFQFLKQAFNHRLALNATGILLFSVWFSFSRKIMPDTFSISLILISLRQIQWYWLSQRIVHLILAFIGISLGILCKLPAISWVFAAGFLLPKLIKYYQINKRLEPKSISILITIALATIPGLIWYFYWVPKLNQHFQLFYPKSLIQGAKEIIPYWRLLLEKFYFTAFYSFLSLFLLLVGITFIRNCKKENYQNRNIDYSLNLRDFNQSLIGFLLVFLVFIVKTGDVFPKHNYYIIPAMPFLAVLSALGIEKTILHFQSFPNYKHFGNSISAIILLAAMSEGFLNQMHELKIKPSEWYKLELEKISQTLPKNALVISNAGVNPQELYFLNRKGWVRFPNQIQNQHHLDSLIAQKANYLLINKNIQTQNGNLSYYRTYNSIDFEVYDLTRKSKQNHSKNQ